MAITRNPRGGFVRLGRTEQTVSWSPMISATLPSWLTAPVGTYAGQTATSATAPANGKISSAAAGGAMRLLGPQIIPNQYREIEFTLYGLRFDTNAGFNFRLEIGGTSQDRGVQIRQDNGAVDTETYAKIRGITSAGVFTDHDTWYQHQKPFGGSQKPRNLTFIWRPLDKEAIVLEDDQVMAYTDLSADNVNNTAAVSPIATMEVTDGGSHWFLFNRVDLTLRHN